MKKIALVLMLICFGFSLFAEDSNEFNMFPNLNFSIVADDSKESNEIRMFPDLDFSMVADDSSESNEVRVLPDLDCHIVSNTPNELWNKLSDDEKWFCALSEPFIQGYSLSVVTLNPEEGISGDSRSASILEAVWNLHSKDDVLDFVKKYRLNQLGENVAINEAKASLSRNSKLSINEIAVKECLDSVSLAKLYFTNETQDVLGEYGLLAWDYGHVLAALRLCIAAGWLSEKEAVNLAKPLIDELINDYASWEDYAVHYAFGDVVNSFTHGRFHDMERIIRHAQEYDIEEETGTELTFHYMKFPGKRLNGNRILTYEDAVFNPSLTADLWILLAIHNTDDSIEPFEDYFLLNRFVKSNLKIPAAVNTWFEYKMLKSIIPLAISYAVGIFADDDKSNAKYIKKYSKKMLGYYETARVAFEKVEVKNDSYYDFYKGYAQTAYEADDAKTLDFAVSFLDEEKCQNFEFQELFCANYTNNAKKSASKKNYEEAYRFAKKALTFIEKMEALPEKPENPKIDIGKYEKDLNQMISEYKSHLPMRKSRD